MARGVLCGLDHPSASTSAWRRACPRPAGLSFALPFHVFIAPHAPTIAVMWTAFLLGLFIDLTSPAESAAVALSVRTCAGLRPRRVRAHRPGRHAPASDRGVDHCCRSRSRCSQDSSASLCSRSGHVPRRLGVEYSPWANCGVWCCRRCSRASTRIRRFVMLPLHGIFHFHDSSRHGGHEAPAVPDRPSRVAPHASPFSHRVRRLTRTDVMHGSTPLARRWLSSMTRTWRATCAGRQNDLRGGRDPHRVSHDFGAARTPAEPPVARFVPPDLARITRERRAEPPVNELLVLDRVGNRPILLVNARAPWATLRPGVSSRAKACFAADGSLVAAVCEAPDGGAFLRALLAGDPAPPLPRYKPEVSGRRREDVAARVLHRPWHVRDARRLPERRSGPRDSAPARRPAVHPALPAGVTVVGRHPVFIHPAANIFPSAVVDASGGPVLIDEHATVRPGAS